MAKTAVTVLQDQIEAIRREAYAAGYAAAMRSIRDFTTKPPASAVQTRRPRQAAKSPKQVAKRRGRPPSSARPTTPKLQRGNNAQLIADVLKAMPSGTARPADIRKALQNDKGVAMAFTSIRHALGQLANRHEVEPSADGKTWRYVGTAAGGREKGLRTRSGSRTVPGRTIYERGELAGSAPVS